MPSPQSEAGAAGASQVSVSGLLRGGSLQGRGRTIHWPPPPAPRSPRAASRGLERQGSQTGGLGHPTTGAPLGLLRGGCWQGFEGGYIHWSPATGAQNTTGGILEARDARAQDRPPGLPPPPPHRGPRRGVGRVEEATPLAPATGAQITAGRISSLGTAGLQTGPLGYPLAGAQCLHAPAAARVEGGPQPPAPDTGAQTTTGGTSRARGPSGPQTDPGSPTTGAMSAACTAAAAGRASKAATSTGPRHRRPDHHRLTLPGLGSTSGSSHAAPHRGRDRGAAAGGQLRATRWSHGPLRQRVRTHQANVRPVSCS